DSGESAAERLTVNPANPILVTTANPNGTNTLGASGSPTLKDSADLEGGYNPTGTITFMLHYGASVVDTETVTVSGNGVYTTPAGFTLPTTGTVTGVYIWTASYGGDTNNNGASDSGESAAERLTVNPANPTLVTTANPNGTITLGASGSPTLKDSADLEGGYHPTGTITFMLHYGASVVDTETVTVSGNGVYSTPTGFTLPTTGTVTGFYIWTASYGGDTNNNGASDSGESAAERLTVNPANPTLVTTANPNGTITVGASG